MARKRQYIHDLIRVANQDIKTSMAAHGNWKWGAFGSLESCPILTSLKRHGHKAKMGPFEGNTQVVTIDGKEYKVPAKMLAWQQRGVFNTGRTPPFAFRISELVEAN